VHSFLRAFRKDLKEQGMRIEVARTEDFQLSVLGRKLGSQSPDTFFQDTRKEKEWKHHNTGKSHAGAADECFWQERSGDPDITRCCPPKAHSFPQQTRQFLHVCIGIWVTAAASDDKQEGILPRPRSRLGFDFCDFQPTELDNVSMEMQMTAIMKGDIRIAPPCLLHFAGDIVFGMPCGH